MRSITFKDAIHICVPLFRDRNYSDMTELQKKNRPSACRTRAGICIIGTIICKNSKKKFCGMGAHTNIYLILFLIFVVIVTKGIHQL